MKKIQVAKEPFSCSSVKTVGKTSSKKATSIRVGSERKKIGQTESIKKFLKKSPREVYCGIRMGALGQLSPSKTTARKEWNEFIEEYDSDHEPPEVDGGLVDSLEWTWKPLWSSSEEGWIIFHYRKSPGGRSGSLTIPAKKWLGGVLNTLRQFESDEYQYFDFGFMTSNEVPASIVWYAADRKLLIDLGIRSYVFWIRPTDDPVRLLYVLKEAWGV